MEFLGIIRARADGPPLTFDRWCAFVRQRDDLLPPSPQTGRYPRTGDLMATYPTPDAATVMVHGRQVVRVSWSQSGEDGVMIGGEPALIVPWAHVAAAELDAEFVDARGR